MADEFEEIGPDVGPEGAPHLKRVVKRARDFYNKKEVKDGIRKAEKLLKVAKDVKSGNPFSMAHGVFKLADILYEFEQVTTAPALKMFNELNDKAPNYICNESVTHMAVALFMDPEKIEILESSVAAGDRGHKATGPTLFKYQVRGYPIYWYQDGYEYSRLICDTDADLPKIRAKLQSKFWAKLGNEVELQWSDTLREFAFREKKAHPIQYQGEFGYRLLRRWKKAYEMGMRRFIILHGVPGTGKTTLVRQLGEEIKAKVLYVPTETLLDAGSNTLFADTLELVGPNVVIIDDIDKMPRSELDKLLNLFEETETNVPLLLATTNHLNKLPGAIKRPGRFDEIWEIPPPPEEVRPLVIRYFGELENIDLSEEQVTMISKKAGELSLSGAHIREVVRRLHLEDEGWEFTFDEKDLTFSQKWRPDDYVAESVYGGGEEEDFDDFDDDF